MKRSKRLAIIGGVIAMAAALTGCTQHFTDPSMVALRYAGGLTEGGKFIECVEPGVKTVDNDTYYPYPTTQREDVWSSKNFNAADVAGSSADQGDLEVTDKDGNTAYLQLKTVFTLNTDCETLQEFHEKIGRTRAAYFNEDGTYNSGWLWVMNNYITSAVEEQARNAAVGYTVDELWLDPTKRDALAAAIEENIQKAVDDRMEGDSQFFKIGDISIFGAKPNDETVKLYEERKQAAVRAETADANKVARVAEADADAAVAEAQAKAKAAEIAAYGGADGYVKAKLMEKGINPYQPSYGTAPVPTVDATPAPAE